MKWRALTVVALISLAVASAPAHGATIAYWNDADGRTLTDLSSNNYDLTQASTGNTWIDSAVNVAPNPVPNPDALTTGDPGSIFLNNNARAYAGNATPFQLTSTSSFTFEGWLNGESVTGVIAGDRHGANTAAWTGWYLTIIGGGSVRFYANTGDDALVDSTTAVDDGSSHHYAAVWDHTTSELSLYIDGNLEGTSTLATVNAYSSIGFAIGGRSTAGTTFDDNILDNSGNQVRLDEMRFSNEALATWQFLNGSGIAPPMVPEPRSFAMILIGLSTLVVCRHRLRRR